MSAITEHRTAHIPQWKLKEIENIKQSVGRYPVIGIAGIRDIPAKQLQQMRRDLTGIAKLRIYRNTLMLRALGEGAEDIRSMEPYIGDQTALVFTDLNSFKLFKLLKSSKTNAPIKAGASAPYDIVVSAGPTSFNPGPIVSDLQNAGIPAKIDKGKVVIRETTVVAHTGETVSRALSEMLTRLEIYPMTVGLDLRATYDNGIVLEADVLDIDEEKYASDIASSVASAFNLAIAIVYPSRATIRTLLANAASNARNLGIHSAIPEPDIVGMLLSRAQSNAMALIGSIDDPAALGESLKRAPPKESAVEVEVAEEAVSATEEPEEVSEEEKEEEVAEGLGLLFG
ncbi:MAG: 50S ribosomal protein L10 [Nitrospiraceae bacterium]|nr:50S ribosomal protein L10 [Nitrospiraceae bacterium]